MIEPKIYYCAARKKRTRDQLCGKPFLNLGNREKLYCSARCRNRTNQERFNQRKGEIKL